MWRERESTERQRKGKSNTDSEGKKEYLEILRILRKRKKRRRRRMD